MAQADQELRDSADDLRVRWQRLDIRRFTGRAVGSKADEVPTKLHLAEYQALSSLEEASLSWAKRPSLTRMALAQLDAAYRQAINVNLEATCRVAERQLAECLRAYRTMPAGTVPLSNLNVSARVAWEAFQDSSDNALESTLLLRCSLGEFFKEAYTSKVIADALANPEFDALKLKGEHDKNLLERAFEILEPVKDLLGSGKLLERHDLTVAAGCMRHLAVVHEYYYFRSDCPQNLRASHLDGWLRLSVDAVAVCSDQGEFSTQAYALLNKAAALAELTASDVVESQLVSLVENVRDVQTAQDLFVLTGDDRGLAWAGIHMARIRARQYQLGQKTATSDELKDFLRSMLETAIDAESNSKRIDDEVAKGLAALYLCAAEQEALRLELKDLAISDELEIAERARHSANVLSSTHRLPQAARALQIAAQCELAIAGKSTDDSAKSAGRVRAMQDLTAAISILDESGDLDQLTCDRLIADLQKSVSVSVPKWRF